MNPELNREILKKVRQIEIRTKRLVTDALAGQYHSVFKGRGINFDSVREYVPGDDVRTIDWNVTARAGRPFVKKFVEERELTLLLMVDVSASGDFGSGVQSKRELAAEIASVLAFSAVKNNDKVGLLLFTDQVELYVPPRKGRRHVLRIVREVLGFKPTWRGTDLVQSLDFVNKVIERRAIIFLLSDFLTTDTPAEDLRRALRQTNRRHDLVALPIKDARERLLPDLGVIAIEDAETGELVEPDTRNPAVRQRFAERRHRHRRCHPQPEAVFITRTVADKILVLITDGEDLGGEGVAAAQAVAILADVVTGTALTLVGLLPLPWWQTLTIFCYAMIACLGVNDVLKVVMIKWRVPMSVS